MLQSAVAEISIIQVKKQVEKMRYQYLPDGGPVYAETDLSSFIVEPWNAVSSLAIVLPAVYWAFKLNFKYKRFPFIFYAIPLLILGGVGSTLYHAFRNSIWLLVMDVAPTALLTFSIGVYFWIRVLPKWWHALLLILPATALRIGVFEVLSGELAVNISYLITGILIFLPVILNLIKQNFRYFTSIFISVMMLSASLVFRETDMRSKDLLPMGTHFLWHLLSGIGAFYLGKYLYQIRNEELNLKK